MKKIIRNFILVIFFSFLCFTSCSIDNNPVNSNNDFDSNLIGEWFLFDSLDLEYPSPRYCFYGMQINNNQLMTSLGIETNTGKVSIEEYPRIDSIISATNGKMVVKYFNPFYEIIDTLKYNINANKLIIGEDYYARTYIKTSLNSLLLNPITSNLSVNIDSINNNNLKVYNYPSAYLSKSNTSNISLFVYLKSSRISIEINDFGGVGVYNIPFHKAEYWVYDSDMVSAYFSDSVATATLTIEQYDEINKSCTGKFSFDVYDGYDIQNSRIKFREGSFTVPIYK